MKRVVLFSWIALCLCGLGSILAAEKDNPEVSVGVSLTASDKQSSGKEHLDFHHATRQLPDVESSDTSSPSLSSGWNEPLFRRPWNDDSSISYRNDEYQNYQGPSDPSDPSENWQENEISSANQDVNVNSIEQLNWRDSQLARLHGLGPAEIAALSSWQNRLKMHSLPKRITDRLSKEQVKSSSRSLPWISTDSALFPQVLNAEIQAEHNNLASKDLPETRQTNQTQDDEDILPLWPKRSSNANKIEKENNKVRNRDSNRKEKSESSGGNKGGGKGKGANRKQQPIKQEPSHRHISEEAVGIDVSGTDGDHENSKSSSGSSGKAADVSRLNRNLATQFLLRSPRENRQYDVPIIGE